MVFVCLSGKRTGSTFLYRSLAVHPDIEAHGEMFTLAAGKKNENFLYWKPKKAVTFKLMYNQCKQLQLMSLIKENKLPIIHLIRNSYDKVLSDLVAIQRIGWRKKGKPLCEIHAPEFMRYVKEYDDNIKRFRRELSKYKPYMEIFMEDMVGNKRKAGGTYMDKKISDSLCDFLGVKKRRLWSDTGKTGYPEEMDRWDFFAYAEELKEAIKRRQKRRND
jgi:hypothetical protein